jgi:hypothetical protein
MLIPNNIIEPKAKKYFYLLIFTLSGWLLFFLLYTLLEYLITLALITDFKNNSFGLTWDEWWFIQKLMAVIFSCAGISSGFLLGQFGWRRLAKMAATSLKKSRLSRH